MWIQGAFITIVILEGLRRYFFSDVDGNEENYYQVPSAGSSAPSSEQRTPSIPSVQPSYVNEREHRNPTTNSSARVVEPVRDSTSQQPKATPIRFVSPTPTPSVSQRNFVDSTRPPGPVLSFPPKNPSAPSGSDPPKKPSGSDPPKKPSALSESDPPRKPTALSSSDPPRKPSAPSGSDPPKKSSALSGPDPPKKPSGSSGSDPPKRPPGSPNWETGSTLPVYPIPEDMKDLIKKDMVPNILKKPLSPSTYADYFAALLYAEDHYIEKWSNFLLSGVTLKLHKETNSEKERKSSKTVSMHQRSKVESDKEEKVYVAFEIDSIPEKRPFLLSRDFVFVRHSGKDVEPFQGVLSRVVKSTLVLTEFGKKFRSQHSETQRYDVSFSFNRVCLKRSHQAVEAAVGPSFRGILFPERVTRSRCPIPTSNSVDMSAVDQILRLKAPPPYLIVHDSSPETAIPLRIQEVINEAILQIRRTLSDSRILITAPQNSTCDLLMRGLRKEIPNSEMFRTNAAFRGLDEVPDDILSSSFYEGECFSCPPSKELRKFKVIASTFMSSYRLHCHGIDAGHFSHIFAVDACSVPEPEIMVTLANLADESTAVVLTGSQRRFPVRVRSDIARANGLRTSYFKRLLESEPYSSQDPEFVKHL